MHGCVIRSHVRHCDRFPDKIVYTKLHLDFRVEMRKTQKTLISSIILGIFVSYMSLAQTQMYNLE